MDQAVLELPRRSQAGRRTLPTRGARLEARTRRLTQSTRLAVWTSMDGRWKRETGVALEDLPHLFALDRLLWTSDTTRGTVDPPRLAATATVEAACPTTR